MLLLSRLDTATAPWLASAYMLVVGVGIGLVMQVLVLVVQNDARPENIGVATATVTFFRSMGGSFGIAIFGAIFAAQLSRELSHLPASVVERLGSGAQLSPAEAAQLPPAMHTEFLAAFASSLHGVFLWGMAIAIVRPVMAHQGQAPAHHARPRVGGAQRRGSRCRRDPSGAAHRAPRPPLGRVSHPRAGSRTSRCA